jgi:alpha-tubulin suppressor-like RCC1 family protein
MSPVQVTGLTGVVSVGAGEYHSFAIDNTGDLYVWGNNGSGQLGLDDLTNRLTPTLSGLRNVNNAQGGASLCFLNIR